MSSYFQSQVANFSMSYRSVARKSGVAKAFTTFQSRAVRKIRRLHGLAPLQLDEPKEQNGCVTAAHQQFIFPAEQSPRRGFGGGTRATFFRHQLAPHLAALSTKSCIGP